MSFKIRKGHGSSVPLQEQKEQMAPPKTKNIAAFKKITANLWRPLMNLIFFLHFQEDPK